MKEGAGMTPHLPKETIYSMVMVAKFVKEGAG
jgi:hypothetical protein